MDETPTAFGPVHIKNVHNVTITRFSAANNVAMSGSTLYMNLIGTAAIRQSEFRNNTLLQGGDMEIAIGAAVRCEGFERSDPQSQP